MVFGKRSQMPFASFYQETEAFGKRMKKNWVSRVFELQDAAELTAQERELHWSDWCGSGSSQCFA